MGFIISNLISNLISIIISYLIAIKTYNWYNYLNDFLFYIIYGNSWTVVYKDINHNLIVKYSQGDLKYGN